MTLEIFHDTLNPNGRNRATVAVAWLRHALAMGLRNSYATLDGWYERRRQRCHLAALDDDMLSDIGVERRQARREAARWF